MIKRWLVTLMLGFSLHAQSEELDQIKALFLYNFANLVQWPSEAFDSQHPNLRLCLYGTVTFSQFLDTVDGTLIGERPLEVIKTDDAAVIDRGCHILYVAQSRLYLMERLEQQRQHLFILSVGEDQQFTLKGGVIRILRQRDRLEFDIDLINAQRNRLAISSDLLALARKVNAP